MATAPVVTVGGCGVGLSFEVAAFPRPGETAIAKSLHYVNGGKASNHAVGLRRLGVPAVLLSARGNDAMGEHVATVLAVNGVPQEHVLISDRPTMVGALFVDELAENMILIFPGALSELTPSIMRANRSLLESCDSVVVSLEIPVESAVEALHIARTAGARTVLNLSPSPASDSVGDLLGLADVIVANLGEARDAVGTRADESDAPEELADRMLNIGAGMVVITLGPGGALVATKYSQQREPAYPLDEVLDTSGAGDAFMCGLVAGLYNQWSSGEATALGCRLAALVLRGRGFVEALDQWRDISMTDSHQFTPANLTGG